MLLPNLPVALCAHWKVIGTIFFFFSDEGITFKTELILLTLSYKQSI